MPDGAVKKRECRAEVTQRMEKTNTEGVGAAEVSEMMKEDEEQVRYSDADRNRKAQILAVFVIVVGGGSLTPAR